MNIARVSAIALAMLAITSAAEAAVSVVGNGRAHDCYMQAQFNLDPHGIAICTDALKSDVLPQVDRASTFINRAILRARASDTDGAMADFAAALAIGANDGEVYLNRSATLIGLKRYDEALKDADQAVQLHPARIEVAYYNRAMANEALGNVRAAYDDYEAAVRLQPRFTAAKDQLSRFHLVRSDS